MTIITLRDCGINLIHPIRLNIPESHCSSCDMRFHLCWNRNPIYNKPEFCPFCGEEIEETIDETNDDL